MDVVLFNWQHQHTWYQWLHLCMAAVWLCPLLVLIGSDTSWMPTHPSEKSPLATCTYNSVQHGPRYMCMYTPLSTSHWVNWGQKLLSDHHRIYNLCPMWLLSKACTTDCDHSPRLPWAAMIWPLGKDALWSQQERHVGASRLWSGMIRSDTALQPTPCTGTSR